MINNGWVYSAYCLSSVFDCSLSDMILSSGQRFDDHKWCLQFILFELGFDCSL